MDARALVPELGGEIAEHDLVGLGEHQCYARISARGERLPVFSVRLDPPPTSDPQLAADLAVVSARCYGRDASAVASDLQAAMDRIDRSHREAPPGSSAGPGGGPGQGHAPVPAEEASEEKRRRGEHRRGRVRAADAHQAILSGLSPAAEPRPSPAADGTASDEPEGRGAST